MERVLIEYWQQGLQQQAIAAVIPNNIKNLCHIISGKECSNGIIEDPVLLELLLARSTSMVVAPCYAVNQDQYFFPYLLLVELNADGKFSPDLRTSFPIIPKAVVEPAPLSPISLGFYDNFETYFVMQPPIWLEDHSLLTWHNNLQYAQQMMAEVTDGIWLRHLQDTGFVIQDTALIFPVTDLYTPAVMDIKLLSKRQKIELIDAERNSGKSDYARGLVIDAWMTAAIKKTNPPEYVWVNGEQQPKYVSIFDFIKSDNLSCKSLDELHDELVENYNAYSKGKQAIHNWQQIIDALRNKYADKGGIDARVLQLQESLKQARAHSRHMQVLHSIWLRQLEMVTTWTRIFDFVPFWQLHRLQRLYAFFKQNFPEEKLRDLDSEQLEDIILEKMRSAANSERFMADALHQTENDLRQEALVQEKCLQWARERNENITGFEAVQHMLDAEWKNLMHNALDYWHTNFSLNKGYADFLNKIPSKIDLLIVEHAEYVSPMHAAQLLAISQRAIVMGNYNPIANPRFSVQADYELAKHFELVHCDADFEDLQFDGKLASVGNMWNLVTQGKDADQVFVRKSTSPLQYEYKNIFAVSESYLGSKINLAEVTGIFNWLSNNGALIDQVAIYTVFSAQAQYIRDRLKSTPFANIPVRMLQEPCFETKAISLFSPVYTANDPGPYVFDRGVELFENLKNNTALRIVVIGDISIFKPELHSASGNFAKLFIPKTKKQQQEVSCV